MLPRLLMIFIGIVPCFADESIDMISPDFSGTIPALPKKEWALLEMGNHPITYYKISRKKPRVKRSHLQKSVIVLGELAYFRPAKSKFRSIYGPQLLNYRLSLQLQCWQHLFLLLDTNFLHKKGHAIGEQEKTTLVLVPVDLGIKYYLPVYKEFSFYFKGAAEITGTLITNDTPLVEDIHQSALGSVVGLGCLCNPSELRGFCFDVFLEYSFVELHSFGKIGAEGKRTEIGGLRIGGGIGYVF